MIDMGKLLRTRRKRKTIRSGAMVEKVTTTYSYRRFLLVGSSANIFLQS
jgi:hypothetical protein